MNNETTFTCTDCGAINNLQRHHESYEPIKLVWLCVSCHLKRHKHGVGVASFKKHNIPENFTELYETRTYKELVDMLHVSSMTIWHWVKRLKLPLKQPKGFHYSDAPSCKCCNSSETVKHGFQLLSLRQVQLWKCKNCGKIFHEKISNYISLSFMQKCNRCGSTEVRKFGFKLLSNHSRVQQYQCKKCGRVFHE